MPRYRIIHRLTKQQWEGEATSASEACQRAGWSITDCWVKKTISKDYTKGKYGHVIKK